MQKSYLAKTAPGLRTWVVVDLENVPLGRACSKIAQLCAVKINLILRPMLMLVALL